MHRAIGWSLVAMMVLVLSGCGVRTTTVTTDQGKVTVNDSGNTSWCQVGSDWNYTGGDGLMGEWKIKELVQGGQYNGLCHVVYSGQGMTSNYYFNESGDSGFVEMTLPNGQKFSQSWSQ